MKVKPMLGSFELPGIEYVESIEGRSLAEHRVPGLAGSYFQDLGTAANTVVIAGSRYGDEPRDAFLTSIREIFNAGAPTTFVADINTATDITDVIIEDLRVAESASDASFRYFVRLRKYTKPPEPPAAGFPGLDSGLLDAAAGAMAALEALDALASLPDLGNPTEPLTGSLDSVKAATSGLESVQSELAGLFSADLMSSLPQPDALQESLSAVIGDEARGTGVAAVAGLLAGLNPGNISANLSLKLDDGLSASLDVDTSGLTGAGLGDFQQALALLPSDPAALTVALSGRFDTLKELAVEALTSRLRASIDGLDAVTALVPEDASALLGGVTSAVEGLKGELIAGAFADAVRWSAELEALRIELDAVISGDGGSIDDRLLAYFRGKVLDVVAQVLPPDMGRLPRFLGEIELALAAPDALRLPELTASVAAAFEAARLEFEAGNLTNTVAFDGAVAAFEELVGALEHIVALLRAPIEMIADGVEGLLDAQYDNLMAIEIVDVGDIREIFVKATARVQAMIDEIQLPSVQVQIDALFARLDAAVDEFELPDLFGQVAGLQQQLDGVLGSLDGALYEATASIRNAFAQVRDSLQGLMSSLGSFDSEGSFRFNAQDDIEGFLKGVRETLETTLQPIVEDFQATVRGALEQVQTLLEGVQGEVEGVRQELDSALQGVLDQLQAVDVAGTMQGLRAELEEMLAKVAEVDFDPVVDPVIAQINEMRDVLAKIDVSAMGELQVGALKVSVEVVVNIDFGTQISASLMGEIDELLQLPFDALDAVEASVEGTLSAFAAYGPEAILEPLNGLFEPISEGLDSLDLDVLVEPLNQWHAGLVARLDSISPGALLAPLVEVHEQLVAAFEEVSPAQLVAPLKASIDALKADLGALDLGAVVGELGQVAAQLRALLEQFSPAKLLEPLVGALDQIVAALDGFDPAVILEPLKAVFAALTAPLEALTAEGAAKLAVVLAPLHELLSLCDPGTLYGRLATALSGLRDLLVRADVGGLVAQLNAPYGGMHAAFAAQAGGASISLSASVESLNPAQNERLTKLTGEFQDLRARVDALGSGEAPAALAARYENEVKPQVERIVPFWAREDVSPASVKRAFQLMNPLALDEEVRALYQSLKDKLLVYDPRALQTAVQASFDGLLHKLSALSPDEINGQVDLVLGALTARLDALDLDSITGELTGMAGDVTVLIDAVNPRRVIDQMDGLVEGVKTQVEALQPSALLAGLEEPLAAARAIVGAFDPRVFIEALRAIFDQVQALVAEIDVGVLLEPLVKRLEQLRSELKSALERTEAAFNGMLAAVPV
jgi:hypothetical protein